MLYSRFDRNAARLCLSGRDRVIVPVIYDLRVFYMEAECGRRFEILLKMEAHN
jgi:hypothetical protein